MHSRASPSLAPLVHPSRELPPFSKAAVVPAPIDSSASAVASDLELLKSLVAKLRDAGLGETVSRLVDATLEQPPASGFSLFLAEKTKKVHFIRHAEGFHNAATTAAGGSHDCLLRGELCLDARSHRLLRCQLPVPDLQLVLRPLERPHTLGVPRLGLPPRLLCLLADRSRLGQLPLRLTGP